MAEKNGVPWLEAELDARATVLFSTRLGGVSQGSFESLNLGILTDDRREDVIENRLRLASAAGFPAERVSMGRQVHGAGIAWASKEIPGAYAISRSGTTARSRRSALRREAAAAAGAGRRLPAGCLLGR